MKVFIVDDEPMAQDIIEKFVNRIPFLELLGKYDNAIEALTDMQRLEPDLIFLDIQMPEMTGVEMLKTFRGCHCQIIFTTAYPEYAIDGFDLDITDYLLKPIPFDRFVKAVSRCFELFKLKQDAANTIQDIKRQESDGIDDNYIWAKEGKKLVRFPLDEVVMVKALKDYMEIFLPDRKVLVHITMARLENILCLPKFLRVSRSCIVRKNAIRSIQDMRIETILPNAEKIVIGNTYWERLKPHFKELF
ncbi:LytTR family DNA-binding domain-containing protein [Olivibacter sp. CPCC 100613]|uniref:LytR/AlgR family response regulator transcription factor n=1 Tax=Olivibacter sp. CPCC 100613 TaxID=3079931 RepID=UPI002FF61E22